jgi:hypothetical protein
MKMYIRIYGWRWVAHCNHELFSLDFEKILIIFTL